MAVMTSYERVMTALKGKVPDRIPHFEWIIDQKVRDVICPGGSMEEFTVRMGLDAMLTSPDYISEQLSPNTFKNEWGCIIERAPSSIQPRLKGRSKAWMILTITPLRILMHRTGMKV